ncbi:hypothetical protein [Psychromonas aquimarina]|uniref:hypothetical protein n=1 Tax=Psychromonas aquimarina TaxID=444919 RepID=UPI00040C0AC7|nr:hypothetical protein [Psychromonas aquimarina]
MNTESNNSQIPENDTDKLIEVLGLTSNINEAGYILPDGRLLHLDRSNCFKRKNHLDVLKLLPDFLGQEHSIIDTDMIAFMAREQLVRFCIDGKIHTAVKPTSIQLRKIYSVLAYRSNPFEIIISNAAGMTLAQHTVSGPSMATLVEFFKAYAPEKQGVFSEDEFCLEQDDKHFKLVFRPSMKVVGKMSKKSQMIKMQPQFKEATKLFLKLIKNPE